jgi:exosortase K
MLEKFRSILGQNNLFYFAPNPWSALKYLSLLCYQSVLQHISSYFIVLSVFTIISAKITFKFLGNEELTWLIFPITFVLEIFLNTDIYFTIEKGYVLEAYNISIDKSCSGFTFMTISFLGITYLLADKVNTITDVLIRSFQSFIISYLITLLVNSCRLITLIKYDYLLKSSTFIPYEILHQVIGSFIYFFFLLLTFFIIKQFYYSASKLD